MAMNIGEAVKIFKNIESNEYTDSEKEMAIHKVLYMETHNSITKAEMLDVIYYLKMRL